MTTENDMKAFIVTKVRVETPEERERRERIEKGLRFGKTHGDLTIWGKADDLETWVLI